MKLRIQILNYLKEDKYWCHSGNLERMLFPKEHGGNFKASTVGRCLRLLKEEDKIINKYVNGSVLYMYEMSQEEIYHSNRLEL